MICPVETPCWMLAVAVAFAVIFAKEVFGGTYYNFLNVALVTRAFLFFAYPSQMSGDHVFVSLGESAAVDGFSGATPLGQARFICRSGGSARCDRLSPIFGRYVPRSLSRIMG